MPNFWMVSLEPEMSSTRINITMAKMLSAQSNISALKSAIRQRRVAAVQKIRADGRERRLSCPEATTAFCLLGHVSLASHSRHLSI